LKEPGTPFLLDLDGVLVTEDSSWNSLHDAFGTRGPARPHFEAFARGDFGYREFMRRDIALWGRRKLDDIEAVLNRTRLMPGAVEAVASLRALGFLPMILSAGIDILARRVAEKLEITDWASNGLEIGGDGHLTGEGVFRVDLRDKVPAARTLLGRRGCKLESSWCLSDNASDALLLAACARPVVFVPEGAAPNGAFPPHWPRISRLSELIPLLQPFP